MSASSPRRHRRESRPGVDVRVDLVGPAPHLGGPPLPRAGLEVGLLGLGLRLLGLGHAGVDLGLGPDRLGVADSGDVAVSSASIRAAQ